MQLEELFPRPGYYLMLKLVCMFLLQSSAVYGLAATPVRKVARIEGDLMIGALFSVHHQPPDDDKASMRQCGAIREQYGIQRVEVMLRTIRQINQDPDILDGVTLGCEIRDSCWFSSVALEQSLEFLSDSLSPVGSSSFQSQDDGGQGSCSKSSQPEKNPVVAVIGPGSSTVSIQVQNLLQLFNIPQIAYSATSKDLSDKSIYKTFLRVCPPDSMQAKAMVDIARRYNWTYVSAVYTEGNYGSSGFLAFKNLAKLDGICIASSQEISVTAGEEEVEHVIRTLLSTPSAKVVICFCQGETVEHLLKAIKRMGVENNFIFIGSDGWANRKELTDGLEEYAAGSITIKPHTMEYEQFNEHYFSLDPLNNTFNPWFRDFWEQKFSCRLEGSDDNEMTSEILQPCIGNESLIHGYQQDTKMGSVVNAIYAVAHALDDMYRDLCPNKSLCDAMDPVDGRDLLKYLYNVSFEGESGERIKFDKKGDPIGRYDLYHFDRRESDGSFGYLQIGDWSNGVLTINDSALVWFKNGSEMVESYCSKPCKKGQVKDIRDNIQCCWACVPCGLREIVKDEFTCQECEEGEAPNAELTDCDIIDVEFMRWSDSQAIFAIVLASLGLICTSFVIVTFIRYNGTPIIKASSRENSYILLIGITTCFALTFPYVSKPSTIVCYLQRICLGLSFCLCYSSLVVRTNRMARILAGSKKKILTRKPRFLSGTAQVVITILIISVEVAIIVAFLIVEPPEAIIVYPTFNTARLICKPFTRGMVAPLGYDAFLVGMCTLYAFKTRNLPENFNEAKYIAFTMYTTCVVWLAFIPLYFGSAHMREIVVCFAVSISSAVALACLFLPKTYIILFKPERNRRSSMTTSTLVRMHVGSFYDSSSRGFSSNNGTVDFSREKLLRSKSNNSRSSVGSGRSSIFASFRRRNNSVPAPKKMLALERDLNQRRRMPVYRFASSSPQSTSPVTAPKSRRTNARWSGNKKKEKKVKNKCNDIIQEASCGSDDKKGLPPAPTTTNTEIIDTKPPLVKRRTRSLDGDLQQVGNGPIETVNGLGNSSTTDDVDPTSPNVNTISKSADDLLGSEPDITGQKGTFLMNKLYNQGPNESPRIIINRAITSSFRNIPSSTTSSNDHLSQCSNPLQLTDNYLYSSSRENSIGDQNSDVIVIEPDVSKASTSETRNEQLAAENNNEYCTNGPVPRNDHGSSDDLSSGGKGSNPFINDGVFDELMAMLVEMKSSDV